MGLFVRTFMPQFAPLVETGVKRQTARKVPKRMPHVGQTFSAREWTGLPYRSKQRLLLETPITSFSPILITPNRVYIDSKNYPKDRFAIEDGFESSDQMFDFFKPTTKDLWSGILIKWHYEIH